MPEYFTSLAAGTAAGPFDRQDLHSDFPVSSVQRMPLVCLSCYGNVQTHGSGVEEKGSASSLRQSLRTYELESPLMGNAVQGDNHWGNLVLFSKLIFKATLEAHPLPLG